MPGGNKHLNYDDRKFIECSLDAGLSFTFISQKLGVHETTISREIKRNMHEIDSARNSCTCANGWICATTKLCNSECTKLCKDCKRINCTKICSGYEPNNCPKLKKKPYVCNGCAAYLHRSPCHFRRWRYDAAIAQGVSDKRASDSRIGIDVTAEELQSMVEVVKPLLKKGQSLDHIWNTHPGQFPITVRTFYSYIEDGLLDILSIDLPKKVKYKKRKRKAKAAEPSMNPIYTGHTYEDFLELEDIFKDKVVEMDCVEGARGSKKVILTLLFRAFNYQVLILLNEHTREQVNHALDDIERLIGFDAFREHMGVILTDHGHEFNNFKELEASCLKKGEKRCKIFFCDPNCPNQKGACEKNHVELRKILPKKTSFSKLTKEAVALVASHINSYTRPILNGKAPISLAKENLPSGLTKGLGIVQIEPEEIVLRPALLSDLEL